MADSTYARMERAIQFLTERAPEQPSLEETAAAAGLSPFHFQREFSDWAGVSPSRFCRYLARQRLAALLAEPTPIEAAADEAGLSSQSRAYDLMVTMDAMTPAEFRAKGAGLVIRYGMHDTDFGHCVIARTERGICGLQFIEPQGKAAALAALRKQWPNAELRESPRDTAGTAAQLFIAARGSRMRLHVQGTNFQIKVWEALLKIPFGQVSTYQRIAEAIGQPTAARAVGQAVGANPIGFLIPCHRVIRREGILGNYRWGAPRKAALVGWEQAAIGR
ncbi:MAG: methylated-DNA--[protein]-cysteine S-methyltransferase [Candidatus Hydrogenedens sp.]|nr:methylated-DNA--[protein]-cysteine S-methyltransferase [Candidatus Hydrogenedens sp.]